MFIRKRFKRLAFVSRLIALPFAKTSLLRGTTDILSVMHRIFSKVLLALIFFDNITQMLKGNSRLFEHLD